MSLLLHRPDPVQVPRQVSLPRFCGPGALTRRVSTCAALPARNGDPSSLRPRPISLLLALTAALLAAGPAAAQAPSALAETLRKVSTRYALTGQRIADLVGRRLDPQPLPDTLPNPFYAGTELSELAVPQPETVLPDAPDISDADTLARIAPTLRVSGLVVRNGEPHLIINAISCKVGDYIPIPGRDRPVFLQVRGISPTSYVLGLNEAEVALELKL